MKYTRLYPKLVNAVCEMNYQLAFNHDKINLIKPKLDALWELACYVRNHEIKVGNARNETSSVESLTDISEQISFLFELDNIVGATESLIQIYSSNESLNMAIQDGSLHQVNTTLGETDVVPISESENLEDMVEYLNNNINRFLKYTSNLTPDELSKKDFLRSILPELASDISLEVTEVERPAVYKHLKFTESLDTRFRYLGLNEHVITDFIRNHSTESLEEAVEDLLGRIIDNYNPHHSDSRLPPNTMLLNTKV